MIVVDTNVIAYLFVPGDRTEKAEAALARDNEWVAPPLWCSEFRNVLVRLVRRGTLDDAKAFQIMRRAERQMRDREYGVSSGEVLTLALRSGCSAYDCEFVALARSFRTRLLTVDRQVLAAFPDMAIGLDDFVA